MRSLHYDVAELRSKSWSEFAAPGAPEMHFVITVCDNARGESCPVWPGRPLRAHWGVADPAAAEGPAEDVERAFRRAYLELDRRIELFTSLPTAALDRLALQERLEAIGKARCRTRVDRAVGSSPDCSPKRPAAFTQASSRFDCVTKRESPSVKRSWRPKWSWS